MVSLMNTFSKKVSQSGVHPERSENNESIATNSKGSSRPPSSRFSMSSSRFSRHTSTPEPPSNDAINSAGTQVRDRNSNERPISAGTGTTMATTTTSTSVSVSVSDSRLSMGSMRSKAPTDVTRLSTGSLFASTPLSKREPVNHNIQFQKPINKDPNVAREIENLRSSYRQQNFWKYHLIKTAPFEFYMTTNPDKRHRFVRNAPSYFVKLETPNDIIGDSSLKDGKKKLGNVFKSESQVDRGFRLIFTQQQIVGINGCDGYYKSFMVEKLPKDKGGHYKITCQYNEFQEDWNIHNNVNFGNSERSRSLNFQFTNINSKMKPESHPLPSASTSNVKETNSKVYDERNGLIFDGDYTMGEFLHVCSIKDKKKSLFVKSKFDGIKLAKANSVYFMDTGFFKQRKWFDPVVAVFRPCNRDVKNKITKSMLMGSKMNMSGVSSKKLFSADKLNVDFSSMHMKGGDGNEEADDDDDEYDAGDDDEEDEEMSDNIVDTEASSKSNFDKFYNAKDGLYNRHPKDDSPNDFKLGWLTVYEKGRYFEKIPNGGNWQMVVGLTLAAAFEKQIDKYVKDTKELLI